MAAPVSQWGDGERVAVLVHGLTGDPGIWLRVGPALAERGFRVVAVTLPGHGGTGAASGWSAEVLAQAVLDQAPAAPDLAIGHSLGGYTLSVALDRLAPRVVVYEDPVLDLTAAAPALLGYRAQKQWTAADVAAAYPLWPQGAWDAKLVALAGWDPEIVEVLGDPTAFPEAPVRQAGAGGEVSSTFVLASPSALVPPAVVERLRDLGHEVVPVDGAGHSVHHDRFEGFMAAVDDALAAGRP
ncbi:alpha/beta fold hydrolase [Dermatophilaceae bacterium Soc4.6]